MANSSISSRNIGIPTERWTNCLASETWSEVKAGPIVVGVLEGEGIGPEVIGGALRVLDTVAKATGLAVEVSNGGPIGRGAEKICGVPLSEAVVWFCKQIFARRGAVLNGPGGGRYVYDLRREFDLFLKIVPLQIVNGLPDASRLRPEAIDGTDLLITRENTGGIYQGTWCERTAAVGERIAEHHIAYSEFQVRRFLQASARLAQSRRGELTVAWKESGLPSLSALWRDCAEEAGRQTGIRCRMVDIDLLVYCLIQETPRFDVIAAPNLFGDVLADLGAVLLGGRGLSFSGNYNQSGYAVYQTNHGAAYDLAGLDRANPVAQILSLAMMLRESFGLAYQAEVIAEAVRSVWREGWRTADMHTPGTRIVGTQEMSVRIADRAALLVREAWHPVRAKRLAA